MKNYLLLVLCWVLFPCLYAQELSISLVNKARHGDAEAQNNLALYYMQQGNEKEALHWWKESAENGYALAQANLGDYYLNKNDYTTGFKWVSLAAKNASEKGITRLAFCYLNGIGTSKDIQKALEWGLKAADTGYVNAMGLVATIYANYYNDKEKAMLWFKRAADAGDLQALNWLGAEEMKVGNTDAGLSYFMKAANKGFAPAQLNVGIYYCNTHEYELAKIWLEMAANQGEVKALELLKRKEFQ